MRRSFWDKKFPTALGLLLIGISSVVLGFSTRLPQFVETGANTPLEAEDIRVSNQTGTSLSISFRTQEEVGAQIRFGQTLSQLATVFDDRDEIGMEPGLYRTHHFTVNNLSPSEQYVFTILIGGKTFDNQGTGFPVGTATVPASAAPSLVDPIRGVVLTPQGEEGRSALVFAKIEGATLVSTVTKGEGAFLIPLSDLTTADLASSYTFRGEPITIEVFGNDGESSLGNFPFNLHASLPPITLGKNVDAIKEEKDTSGFTPVASSDDTISETIVTPKDGDFLADTKPIFRGKGAPRGKVQITIESEPQTVEVTSNANGEWFFQPDTALEPGPHTVTVRFFDGATVTRVIQHEFEVFASGSQVAESATASPIPTKPLPTVSIAPTAAPLPQTGGGILPTVVIPVIGFLLMLTGLKFALTKSTD